MLEKFKEFIDNLNEEYKEKFLYIYNMCSEDYILNNKEILINNLEKLDLNNVYSFKRPVEDKFKSLFEVIDKKYIVELLQKKEIDSLVNVIERDCMIFLSDHLNIDESKLDNYIKQNYLYKCFTDYNLLNIYDIKSSIKDEFNKIDNEEYNILDVKKNINSNIKDKLNDNIIKDYGSFEKFKNSKKTNESDKNLENDTDLTYEWYINKSKEDLEYENFKYIEIATKSNKIYEMEKRVFSGILSGCIYYNRDYTKFDDIVADVNLLNNYPLCNETTEYVKECFKDNKAINIDEVKNKLILGYEQNTDKSLYKFKLNNLELYKKYGGFYIHILNEEIIEKLDKDKIEETFKYTHGIYDEKTIVTKAILGDKFSKYSKEDIKKMNSYLEHFNYTGSVNRFRDNMEFLSKNSEEIMNKDYSIKDVIYIKNIRNNKEIHDMFSKCSNDLKNEILNINIGAEDYEICNILSALSSYKEDKTICEESFTNIQRNLSSIPADKRDELKKLVLDTKFKNYKSKLNINKDITFGVELEIENIKEKLMENLKLSEKLYPTLIEKYSIKSDLSSWKNKYEVTLKSGVEVVSPILKDREEDWQSLKDMCIVLKNLGGEIEESCGGHIHVGYNILGTDSKAWDNLLTTWSETEKIMYKIINPPDEKPRKNILKHAPPVSPIINEMLENGSIEINSDEDIKKLAKEYTSMYLDNNDSKGRVKSLNLHSIASEKQNTIELRIPNGQLDYIELQRNIHLFTKIVETSKIKSENPEYKKDLFDKIKDDKTNEEEKVLHLLDYLFDDIYDKAVYYERYLSHEKELELSGGKYDDYIKQPIKKDDNIYK